MSQRDSGYERIERDQYETPAWVTEALLPHIPAYEETLPFIWEPACGTGKMMDVLRKAGYAVYGTDISEGHDFLIDKDNSGCTAIITNPPYSHAKEFIERALELTKPWKGSVAMLLRTDYDHAKTRQYLFEWPFAKKLVLTKRIVWFERPGAAPSFNHAWYIWDWRHHHSPTLAYGPKE